jgi:glycosyltransferase involved in cell wall biosynthesis
MKIISTSYTNTAEFTDPYAWLDRISFYTGILEELAKSHDVESIEQINYSGKVEQNKVTYHFLNFGDKKNYFPFKLHNYIKNLKPDIVFVNGFIFPLQIIQLRMTLGRHVRLIILHRAEKPFTGIKKHLQQMADNSVDAYLFSSLNFGDEWMKHGIIKNKNKIHEVIQASSSFIPLEKNITRSLLSIEGSPIFLWVGRLNSNKDPITVIKAFKNYLKDIPTARLYMIYQSDELIDEIKKMSADTEEIMLIGKIEHKNLQYWYSSADFIISGSHYEGSGIAVSEAMSCGCIPILTNISSFRSMTGNCGLKYEAGNDIELYDILKRTKEMNMKHERDNVLKQFNDELSFNAIARKINTVISSINRK